MIWRGKPIAAGDTLLVMHDEQWCEWVVSDFSPRTGEVYGRRAGGPYEPLPATARRDVITTPAVRHVHRVALGPTLDEVVRQNTARLADEHGEISFAAEARYAATNNRFPPPPRPLTKEEAKAERARVKAEREAHLAARDQCIREIRERDRAAGIVCITSGHLGWRSRY